MRKGFLIYEEMRKYFPIYEEAVSHIWLCNCSILNFLIYENNFLFFFISVGGGERGGFEVSNEKRLVVFWQASKILSSSSQCCSLTFHSSTLSDDWWRGGVLFYTVFKIPFFSILSWEYSSEPLLARVSRTQLTYRLWLQWEYSCVASWPKNQPYNSKRDWPYKSTAEFWPWIFQKGPKEGLNSSTMLSLYFSL